MDYEVISGQVVNKEKSKLYFGNIQENRKANILEELDIPEGQLPIKYLGAPILILKEAFLMEPMLEKIRGRIRGWSGKLLTFGLELVKSVLTSIPIYSFSVSLLPR